MPNTKITALTSMTGAETSADDVVPIVDVSATQTKKITRTEFFTNTPAIGIGVASPVQKLEVDGSIIAGSAGTASVHARNGDATNYSQLRLRQTATEARIAAENGGTGTAAPLTIHNNGSERMRIETTGNVGIATTTPLVPLDVNGIIFARSELFKAQPAPTTKAAAATLTMAELLTDIIQYTGALATLTAPLATDIIAGLPASMPDNASFDVSIINTGSGVVTLAGNTGTTLIGSGAVTNGTSGLFRVRKTGAAAIVIYRLA